LSAEDNPTHLGWCVSRSVCLVCGV